MRIPSTASSDNDHQVRAAPSGACVTMFEHRAADKTPKKCRPVPSATLWWRPGIWFDHGGRLWEVRTNFAGDLRRGLVRPPKSESDDIGRCGRSDPHGWGREVTRGKRVSSNSVPGPQRIAGIVPRSFRLDPGKAVRFPQFAASSRNTRSPNVKKACPVGGGDR